MVIWVGYVREEKKILTAGYPTVSEKLNFRLVSARGTVNAAPSGFYNVQCRRVVC
jgi:hypothetical protein